MNVCLDILDSSRYASRVDKVRILKWWEIFVEY